MLIGFIGAPASGKTTVASILFSKLKTADFIADMITERARRYILEKKKTSGSKDFRLTNRDQWNIIDLQIDEERLYLDTLHSEEIIVSDSSILNNLLYIENLTEESKGVIRNHIKKYDLLFYCQRSSSQYLPNDTGRVHSLSESNQLDARIPSLLQDFEVTAFKLLGPPSERGNEAYREFLRYIKVSSYGIKA